MKKNLVMKTLVFLFCMAVAYSCQKTKYCWKCTTFVSTSGAGSMNSNASATSNVCDKSQAEITKMIKEAAQTSRSGSVTVRTYMSCQRQIN